MIPAFFVITLVNSDFLQATFEVLTSTKEVQKIAQFTFFKIIPPQKIVYIQESIVYFSTCILL